MTRVNRVQLWLGVYSIAEVATTEEEEEEEEEEGGLPETHGKGQEPAKLKHYAHIKNRTKELLIMAVIPYR